MFVIDSLNEYCDYNKSYLFMLSTVDLFHAALTSISRYVYSFVNIIIISINISLFT